MCAWLLLIDESLGTEGDISNATRACMYIFCYKYLLVY